MLLEWQLCDAGAVGAWHWGDFEELSHIQGQRRSPNKMVGGAKLHLECSPYLPETHRGLKQTLCTPGHRDHTETETELCLSVSRGGTGQQWTAAGTGALGAVDLGTA